MKCEQKKSKNRERWRKNFKKEVTQSAFFHQKRKKKERREKKKKKKLSSVKESARVPLTFDGFSSTLSSSSFIFILYDVVQLV